MGLEVTGVSEVLKFGADGRLVLEIGRGEYDEFIYELQQNVHIQGSCFMFEDVQYQINSGSWLKLSDKAQFVSMQTSTLLKSLLPIIGKFHSDVYSKLAERL